MHSLDDALESFNRKERNLLVRKILSQEGFPCLSERFRNQVAHKLGLQSIQKQRGGRRTITLAGSQARLRSW
jgi:hypothetical protein